MSATNSIFSLDPVFKFNYSVYKLKIACKTIVALSRNNLIRCNLNEPNIIEEIKIPQDDDYGYGLFIDPTGCHVIVCMQSGHTYYIAKSSKKPKLIKEAKGLCIDCVAWNLKQGCDFTTQYILLGTSSGCVIEAKLSNAVGNCVEYWKPVHKFDKPITGIHFDSFPDSSCTKYFLVITTTTDINYAFFNFANVPKGLPLFSAELEKISAGLANMKCTTFPYDIGYGDLDFLYPKNEQFPKFLSYFSGAGIYYAPINANPVAAEMNFLLRPKLLTAKIAKCDSIVNTSFHIIIQTAEFLDFICTLTEESDFQLNIEKQYRGKVIGLCKDLSTNTIYCFTNSNLYRINCDNETKNLWKIFVETKNFSEALKYCHNEEEKNEVLIKNAEYLFSQEKYIDAAKTYGTTNLCFEEVALKLIDLQTKEPLKQYLLHYTFIANKGRLSDTTFDVLCIWLLQLFFEQYFNASAPISVESLKVTDPEFKTFIESAKVIESFRRNRMLIYEKIRLHGDSLQSSLFAEIIKDTEKIIFNLINKGQTLEALDLMKPAKAVKYHYEFGEQIMAQQPKELVNVWMKLKDKLDIKKLLPMLRKAPEEIAKPYVKHAIFYQSSNYEELHNFYIFLCAKLADTTNNAEHNKDLMEYLTDQGNDPYETKYDPQVALRICTEWKNLEGSVFLYCLLSKHREAVEFALKKKNIKLAKDVEAKVIGFDDLKKNLCLQIAQYIIQENNDISEVCEFVKEHHVLKLEDILPYFPDSVKIESFSEAICNSLDYYHEHIKNLHSDMKLSTKYADKIREEINFLKQQPLTVQDNSNCSFCSELLTIRPFCLFPCGHYFHLHCLESIVTPMLSSDDQKTFRSVKGKLVDQMDNSEFKNQYNNMIAKDCCYCGKIAIENVDVPVISFNEFDEEMKLWM